MNENLSRNWVYVEAEKAAIIKREAAKISYPQADAEILLPSEMGFSATIKKYRDTNTGQIVEMDAPLKKLLASLANMIIYNREHGDGSQMFTLDSIIKFDNGNPDKVPTKIERKRYAAMLETLMYPVIIPQPNNFDIVTHFAKMLIAKDVPVNGQKTDVYFVESVIKLPLTNTIKFYQLRLPEGYPSSQENITIQMAIFDKARKGSNRTVDLDEICSILRIRKGDAKSKTLIKEKTEYFIKYYGFNGNDGLSIQRTFRGRKKIIHVD